MAFIDVDSCSLHTYFCIRILDYAENVISSNLLLEIYFIRTLAHPQVF